MKRIILITFLSFFISAVSHSQSFDFKKRILEFENFNLECRITEETIDYPIMKTEKSKRPHFYKIEPLLRNFNFNLSNYKKLFSDKDVFKYENIEINKKRTVTIMWGRIVSWEDILQDNLINKSFQSANNKNIIAQVYSQNLFLHNNEFRMSIYNLDKENFENYIQIQKRPPIEDKGTIKDDGVWKKEKEILGEKSIYEELFDKGLHVKSFKGSCRKL